MSAKRRFLIVTLDAAGNWPPEQALIRGLVEHGHDVRVVSSASHASQIAAAGAQYSAYRWAQQRDPAVRPDNREESERVRVLRETFLNLTFADEVLDAVKREAPDVILVDQMLLAGAAAAESTGLPMAILWHTVFARNAQRTAELRGAMLEPLNRLREKLGVPRISDALRGVERSHAILAFTYEEFDAKPSKRPAGLHYVGPLACLPHRLQPYSLPWSDDDARPLILVSYSTSFQDQVQTLQRVADAVGGLLARVLLTLGSAISAQDLELPDNVVAEKFVPHSAVLPRASLVITHAGHGTVMAAVTAGVPLVCTPMGRDQFMVAERVEQCRLGVVASMTASSEELRRTIAAALKDESLRQRAQDFATGLDLEAGLHRAISVLEELRPPGA